MPYVTTVRGGSNTMPGGAKYDGYGVGSGTIHVYPAGHNTLSGRAPDQYEYRSSPYVYAAGPPQPSMYHPAYPPMGYSGSAQGGPIDYRYDTVGVWWSCMRLEIRYCWGTSPKFLSWLIVYVGLCMLHESNGLSMRRNALSMYLQ